MDNNNPILEANNIADFLKLVNKRYQLELPTDFSENTPISQIILQLQTEIQEIQSGEGCRTELHNLEGQLYTAIGKSMTLDSTPFNFSDDLKLRLSITVFEIIGSPPSAVNST
ncbi:MAG: hypothetical protein QNJ72_05495 [Pleurocapsa sp. MO_226.B13]|nr:hypothetical protein [Pleurocapsa sp. MO_226.B13]